MTTRSQQKMKPGNVQRKLTFLLNCIIKYEGQIYYKLHISGKTEEYEKESRRKENFATGGSQPTASALLMKLHRFGYSSGCEWCKYKRCVIYLKISNTNWVLLDIILLFDSRIYYFMLSIICFCFNINDNTCRSFGEARSMKVRTVLNYSAAGEPWYCCTEAPVSQWTHRADKFCSIISSHSIRTSYC